MIFFFRVINTPIMRSEVLWEHTALAGILGSIPSSSFFIRDMNNAIMKKQQP